MKMKNKIRLFSFMALACVAFLGACVFLDAFNIDQPQPDGTMAPKIEVGQVATFTIEGHMEVSGDRDEPDRLVFAMLAPRGWNIKENTTVTYRGSQSLEWDQIQTMSVIPTASAPKNMPAYTWPEALMERFGLGTNRFNDMEWVAWQADEGVPIFNGSRPKYEITVKCKVGDENASVCLGFFVNDIADGLTGDDRYYKVVYSDPFTVYGGIGDIIDYTKVRFNTVEPIRSLQDDIVTFTFSGEAYDNELVKCDEIFFEATAYTAEGGVYERKEHTDATVMTRENTFTHNYSLTLWPVGFFGIPEGETITKIDYVFTNRDGSVIVNKSLDELKGGGTPENMDTPFTFNLVCGV